MIDSEELLEERLVKLGLNAERVKPSQIDSKIKRVEFHVFPNSYMTVCNITLENNFSVIGSCACAHPKNFNEQIGRDESFINARTKIWELEGYLLKQKLFEQGEA